jgi:colanic acid biosynthesis glycosyl transferase WcaI
MKILLLTNYFPPEVGTGPHMPHELGDSLVKRGHRVTVVTGFPRYNVPVMPAKYRGRMRFKEEIGGMQVLRINAISHYGRSVFSRGMVQLVNPPMLGLQAMLADKPDLVYTISPPLLMGVLARLAAWRFNVPCVVNIQDLFPQTMIDLGILKNKPLIKLFEWMERFVYRSATALTAMSDGNRAFIISRGAAPEKVHTIFNWTDVDAIQPGPRMNDFRREHGLGGQFIVVFAGTMGSSQGLEVAINAARQLAYVPDLLFLLIGEGMECERLKRAAEGLKNVRFLPMQPKEVYPQILAAADVCLVTLRPEVLTPTVPSKISTIMAAGRPIVASIPLHGDAPRFISASGGGLVVEPANARALADAILALKNDPEKARQMGASGRTYAEKNFSRTVCVDRIEGLFQAVLAGRTFAESAPPAKKESLPVTIRPARRIDLDAIVEIHTAAFRGFTLSDFGPEFLRRHYELVLDYEQCILQVAEAGGRIEGFVAGFVNPKAFYAELKRNKWRLMLPVLKAVPRRPWLVTRLVRVILRGRSFMSRPETQEERFCELASVAVRPLSAGRGIGRTLVQALVEEARKRAARKVYLTTDAKDNRATNKFYQSLGFRLAETFLTPNRRVMNEYEIDLDKKPQEAPVKSEAR